MGNNNTEIPGYLLLEEKYARINMIKPMYTVFTCSEIKFSKDKMHTNPKKNFLLGLKILNKNQRK